METYLTARKNFIDTVLSKGGNHTSLILNDIKGCEGEELSIDIGYFGQENPEKLVIHSSGIHGVEGFHGSDIQLKIISDNLPDMNDNIGLLFIHCINPYGMSWIRRFNESNVDLNRNFREDISLQCSEVYETLNTFLNPTEEIKFPRLSFLYGFIKARLSHSMEKLTQGVVEGQNKYKHGLFNIGDKLEKGPEILLDWLKHRFHNIKLIINIDVHSGLGKYGDDAVLTKDNDYFSFFGDKVKSPGNGTYDISGFLSDGFKMCFPTSDVYGFAHEFGTFNPPELLRGLISENYYHHYQHVNVNHVSKVTLKNLYYPNDEIWRLNTINSGIDIFKTILNRIRNE